MDERRNDIERPRYLRMFLRTIPRDVANAFLGWNTLWHVVAIALTAALVLSGFDWWYFVNTRGIPRLLIFPAVILGAFIPLLVPVGMLLIGYVRTSDASKKLAYTLGQAALIGSLVSSAYKAFTGRMQPPFGGALTDTSRDFNFGFLRHGIFWGWPSSHATIAFAMAVALITLVPKNRPLKAAALLYAFYVGLAVSVSIHWFSEFAAGAIIGSVIGRVVGHTFANVPDRGPEPAGSENAGSADENRSRTDRSLRAG
ncbi:MAG: phosphatase PAP2 family protein [Thermoanaerobaculia bacterium]